MLLQTNSYIVPKDKRVEHARVLNRFRQTLARLGCDHLEVYEQVGANWSEADRTGRYVQIMRFRDRQHHLAVQAAERADAAAQAVIAEFCRLINFPYQQQHGLFAVGFYKGVTPVTEPAEPPSPAPDAAATAGLADTGLSFDDSVGGGFGPDLFEEEPADAGAAGAGPAEETLDESHLLDEPPSEVRLEQDESLDSFLEQLDSSLPPQRKNGDTFTDHDIDRALDDALKELNGENSPPRKPEK